MKELKRIFAIAGWKIRGAFDLLLHPSKLIEYLLDYFVRPIILRFDVSHIYGPEKISYAPDELIVLCVVRNGELYIKSFLEHYLAMGVKHIIFLDNGSTDTTIEIAKRYDYISIFQTKCPYRKYETIFKKYLVYKFSKNRWNLFADIDELFDYPYSSRISIKSFLTYLNQKSYTAVVTHMLDLFSDKSLASLKSHPDDSIKDIYTYYDISNISKEPYPYYSYSTPFTERVNWYCGGIRKTVFETNNFLTKASLVFVDSKIRLFINCHQVRGASIADVTGVLYHYPFLSTFYEKVLDAVKVNRYAKSASQEYEMYLKRLEIDPGLNIMSDKAYCLETVDTLVDNGFLDVSASYKEWVTESLENQDLTKLIQRKG